jgi:hypothetical protein
MLNSIIFLFSLFSIIDFFFSILPKMTLRCKLFRVIFLFEELIILIFLILIKRLLISILQKLIMSFLVITWELRFLPPLKFLLVLLFLLFSLFSIYLLLILLIFIFSLFMSVWLSLRTFGENVLEVFFWKLIGL